MSTDGAIVHEWVAKVGGSEKVLEQFVELFPQADIYTLWSDVPDVFGRRVKESWISRTPLRRHKALATPFLPLVWRGMRSKAPYDWMLISSHLFAHHARFAGENAAIPKLVYAHTPARYIWSPDHDPRGRGLAARLGSTVLRPIDRMRAREAHSIVANSDFTRRRIESAWRRDADVIYPPVDTERMAPAVIDFDAMAPGEHELVGRLPEQFLLGASRFVTYKRLDRVIEIGAAMQVPVVLAGKGPERSSLASLADELDADVTFVDGPSDPFLHYLYCAASAYIFPAIEDFGIMPVEAMAAGTPTVVSSIGGACESVKMVGCDSIAGDDNVDAWVEATRIAMETDRSQLAARAAVFSASRFRREVAEWVTRSLH